MDEMMMVNLMLNCQWQKPFLGAVFFFLVRSPHVET